MTLPPSKKRVMVDKAIIFLSDLIKSQGFTVVLLTGILAWNQYNYVRLEDKIDVCNSSVVRMYAEDRLQLIGVLNEATETIQAAKKKIKCGD